jgi:hypothetical protein
VVVLLILCFIAKLGQTTLAAVSLCQSPVCACSFAWMTSTWIYLSEGEGHSYGALCRSQAIYEPVMALICYPNRYASTVD